MIAPYLGGVFYWPFELLRGMHHGDVFLLRKLGVLLGLASMLLTCRVVRALAGARLALLVAFTIAVTPTFVAVHATLVHFETLPWLLMMGAASILLPRRALFSGVAAPCTGSDVTALCAAAFLLGCAVLANLKTVLLLAPALYVARRLGLRAPVATPSRWAAIGLAAMLPLLLFVPVALAPSGAYGDRASGAHRVLLHNLADPLRIVPYARDMILFWSNVAHYLERPIGASHPNPVASLLAAGALALICVETVRTLRARRGCVLAATTGLCLIAHLLVVTLLYDSYPANFAPLHAVFAIAGAVAIDRALTWLAARDVRPVLRAAFPVAALAPFAFSAVLLIVAMRDAHVPANASALRALVSHLEAHAAEGATIVSTDGMLTGVVESLSGGAIRTVQAQTYLHACTRGRDRAARGPCLEGRFAHLLGSLSERTLRVVVATDPGRFAGGRPAVARHLLQAARHLGRTITLEAAFRTPRGESVLEVYRVHPRGEP
jgi:hypothetical protein